MTYLKSILIAIDQLGNAITGGNPDCTISGRVGYYQYNGVKPYVWYWHLLAFIIDLTFYPWDGHHHCREAYNKEVTNTFNYTNNAVLLFLLSIITLTSCSIMASIFWIIYTLKELIKLIFKNRPMLKKEFWKWMITVRTGAFFLSTFFALIFLVVPIIPYYQFPYSWIVSICAIAWWWFGNVYRLFTIWNDHVKDQT